MSADSKNYHEAVDQFKKEFLAQMLTAHNGNRTHTAKAIGLQRTYLLRLLRQFGLNQFRPKAKERSARCPPKTNGVAQVSPAVRQSVNGGRPMNVEAFVPSAVNISFPQLRAV
jgi:hypothetical protein